VETITTEISMNTISPIMEFQGSTDLPLFGLNNFAFWAFRDS